MAAKTPEHDNQRGLLSFFRRRHMARKSAPSTAPTVSPSLFESGDNDSAEASEADLPESGDSNGNEDPPSRQLRRESRMSANLSKEDVAETVAEASKRRQPSSPSKSVHFSSDVVQDDEDVVDRRALGSVFLLQYSKSRPQPTSSSAAMKSGTGKLKRPAIRSSSPQNGEIDDPTRHTSSRNRRNDGRADTYEVEETPMHTRKQSRELDANGEPQEQSRVNIHERKPLGWRQTWTDEDLYTLKVLRDAGVPWDTLEKIIPHRTYMAIYNRYQRIPKTLNVPGDAQRRIREQHARLLQSVSDGQTQQFGAQTSERTKKRSLEQDHIHEAARGRSAKRTKQDEVASLRPQGPVLRSRKVRHLADSYVGGEIDSEIIVAEDQQMDDEDELFVPMDGIDRRSPVVVVQGNQPTSQRATPKRDTRSSTRRSVSDARGSRQAVGDGIEQADVEASEEDEDEELRRDATEGETEEQQASATVDRLYGQQPVLNKIFSAIEQLRKDRKGEYTVRYRENNEIQSIRNVSKICEQTASNYANLQGGLQYNEPFITEQQELERTLSSLLKIISKLDPDQKEDENEYATQVYLYVFPGLIDLLQQAAKFYSTVASLDDSQLRHIDLTGLEPLVMIGKVIQTLDRHSRHWIQILNIHTGRWKAKPDTDMNVMRPIRYQVLAPLKRVLELWQRHLKNLRQKQAQIEAARQDAEDLRCRREDEERRMKADKVRQKKVYRLRELYMARMAMDIEPDIHRRRFLRMPKLNSQRPEIDANGEEFERIPMFTSRPPSSHLPHPWEDGVEEWRKYERAALMEALEKFQGKDLWKTTFGYYCRPYGRLRDRTVAEILKQAKYMQEAWIQWDREHGEETEDWIINIPDLDLLELL